VRGGTRNTPLGGTRSKEGETGPGKGNVKGAMVKNTTDVTRNEASPSTPRSSGRLLPIVIGSVGRTKEERNRKEEQEERVRREERERRKEEEERERIEKERQAKRRIREEEERMRKERERKTERERKAQEEELRGTQIERIDEEGALVEIEGEDNYNFTRRVIRREINVKIEEQGFDSLGAIDALEVLRQLEGVPRRAAHLAWAIAMGLACSLQKEKAEEGEANIRELLEQHNESVDRKLDEINRKIEDIKESGKRVSVQEGRLKSKDTEQIQAVRTYANIVAATAMGVVTDTEEHQEAVWRAERQAKQVLIDGIDDETAEGGKLNMQGLIAKAKMTLEIMGRESTQIPDRLEFITAKRLRNGGTLYEMDSKASASWCYDHEPLS